MSPQHAIRRALPDDVPELEALAHHVFKHAYSHTMDPGDLAAHVGRFLSAAAFAAALESCVILVAEQDGRMMGFTQFGPTREETAGPDDRELIRLYVHPDYQNRGIGSGLLTAALEHPVLASAPRVFLEVWEKNYGAMRLYCRYGFELFGARKFEVASGAEMDLDLVMVRRRDL